MNHFSLRPLIWIAFFALAILPLSGCLNDDEAPMVPEPYAYVALYNAVPDSPDLDIFLNGEKASTQPLKYSEYIIHSPIPSGLGVFNFINSNDTLATVQGDFKEGFGYTIFLLNTTANMGALVTLDTLGSANSGKALIRVVHLSPDTPPVYVSVEGEEGSLAGNQYFRDATPFIEIDARHTTLKLVRASDQEVLATASNLNLESQKVYTLIIKGFSAPPEGSDDELTLELVEN